MGRDRMVAPFFFECESSGTDGNGHENEHEPHVDVDVDGNEPSRGGGDRSSETGASSRA